MLIYTKVDLDPKLEPADQMDHPSIKKDPLDSMIKDDPIDDVDAMEVHNHASDYDLEYVKVGF